MDIGWETILLHRSPTCYFCDSRKTLISPYNYISEVVSLDLNKCVCIAEIPSNKLEGNFLLRHKAEMGFITPVKARVKTPRQSSRPCREAGVVGMAYQYALGKGTLFRWNSVPETWNSEQREVQVWAHAAAPPSVVPGAAHRLASFFFSLGHTPFGRDVAIFTPY